jgi:hypothetical protein
MRNVRSLRLESHPHWQPAIAAPNPPLISSPRVYGNFLRARCMGLTPRSPLDAVQYTLALIPSAYGGPPT